MKKLYATLGKIANVHGQFVKLGRFYSYCLIAVSLFFIFENNLSAQCEIGAYLTVSPTVACPNSDVYFEAYGTGVTYLWDFGDGSPTSSSSWGYHSYASVGTYEASVFITGSCGNDTTLFQTIEVLNSIPVSDVYHNAYPNPACPGEEINFDAWGYSGDYTYLWNFGDGSPDTSESYVYHSYSAVGSYEATVTISNTCGNDTLLTIPILVELSNTPIIDAGISVDPNPVCPGDQVNFQAWGDVTSYLWNFGDGSPTSSSYYNSHTYSTIGDYTVSMLMTNACGNDTTLYQVVSVGTKPVPVEEVYSSAPSVLCPNEFGSFQAWEYSGNYSYFWDFGDGSPIANDSYNSHAYTAVGTYVASVTITNSCGSDTVLTHTVQVETSNAPVTNVNVSATPNLICPNDQVNFQAWADAISYLWNFGDGSPTSISSYINHSYANVGTYTASVKITNSCGKDTIVYRTINVGVNARPVTDVYVEVSPNPVCPGTIVNFDAWGYEGSLNYLWDFGDGSPVQNYSYSEHAYTNPGSYNASVKITNACGNDTIITQTVEVGMFMLPVTDVFFEISPNPVCPNFDVSFDAWASNGDYSYQWNFGDGSPVSNERYNSHSYNAVGNYPASVKISNSCGRDTTLNQVVVVGNVSIPIKNVYADTNQDLICPNSSVSFNVWGYDFDNAYSFIWDFGDGSMTSNSSQNDHIYTTVGVFAASVTISNSCGNDTVLYKTITVNNNVPISDVGMNISPSSCPNEEVHFDTWGYGETFEWNFGDGSPNIYAKFASHVYPVVGSYPVWVKITNSCGSDTILFDTVTVVNNKPITDVFLNMSENAVCPNTGVHFNIWNYDYGSVFSYLYDFGDGSPKVTTLENYMTHIYLSLGNYPMSVVVTNACGNSITLRDTVKVVNNLPVMYPEIHISPNPVCPNTEVAFDSWGDGSYTWDFGDGSPVSTFSEAYHTYHAVGSFNASVTITNGCGMDTTIYEVVEVANNLPLRYAEMNISSTSVCPNDIISFDAWGEAISFVWDFGDGSPVSTNEYANHSYTAVGSYTVTVQMVNACYSDTTLTVTIDVGNNLPIENMGLYISPNPVCPNDEVSFDAYGNGSSFIWNFGDGSPFAFNQYANHSFPAPGNYPISVKVTNGCGRDTTLYGQVQVQNNLPVMVNYMDKDIEIRPNPACPNSDVSFQTWSNGNSFVWDFGDGSPLSIGDFAQHKYLSPGNYPSSLTITNGCGNDSTFYQSVLVQSDVMPDPSNYDYDVVVGAACVGDSILFYAQGGSGTYLWDFGDGSSTTITTPMDVDDGYIIDIAKHSYATIGNYTATFTLTNQCGNSFTDQFPIIIGNDMQVYGDLWWNSENPSVSDNIGFYSFGGSSYTWNFGDGSPSIVSTRSLEAVYHSYSAPGSYTVSVEISNSCGNSQVFTDYISIGSTSTKPATPVVTQIGKTLHSNAAYGNQWYNQSGVIVGATGQDFIPSAEGSYYVIVTVYGYSSDMSNIVSVLLPCDAQFSFVIDDLAKTVNFTDMSLGTPTSWSWAFGDGSYSSLKNPTHVYSKGGSYSVTLSVISSSIQCVSTVTKQIAVGTVNCQAGFESVINSSNGLANFTSTSQDATDYYWDFGDGNYSLSANPSHTYTKKGLYPVCLTIKNNSNGCQSVACKEVMYMPVDSIYIIADFSFFNDPANNVVNLYDLSSSNTTNWYWTMGDGKMIQSQNPVYTYSKPGVYDVCLIVTDKINGLSSTVCKQVRIGTVPCEISSDFTNFINPFDLKVDFFSMATGSVDNYYWTFGDGGNSTSANPVHQYLNAGYYEVTLVARNSANDCMDKLSKIIQVGSVDCHAGFTFSVDPLNNSVKFEDASKGMIDYYYWDFGNGTFSVDQNPQHLYGDAGNYQVSQFVIDNVNGCVDFVSQPIQVGEINCSADFITYIDSSSNTAYFTNRNLGVSTALLWSFGDGSFSTKENPTHQFPVGGLYSTGLNTYNFNNGCMDFYQEVLLIGGLGIDCNADFVYRVDPASGEVTFSNKSIGNIVSSIWSFGDETESLLNDPVHTYTLGGYYYVCLTVTNSAGIRNTGCKWVLIEGNPLGDCLANFMFTIDSSSLTAKFVDNSFGDISKYTWNFGDGSPDSASTLANPEHVYGQKGYYLVQLTTENPTTGCVSKEYKLLNIADNQVLKAAFGYEAKEPNKKVAGYPVDLVSASSGDGATVEWDFGDKELKKSTFTVMDSTRRIVTHYYKFPGRYEVCLRISDPVRNISDTYCNFINTRNAVAVEEINIDDVYLNVYPNPFTNFTTINYKLEKAQFIEVAIFDQLGRKVETLVKSKQEPGNHKVTWESKSITTGVYHLKMITNEGTITKQLVITK